MTTVSRYPYIKPRGLLAGLVMVVQIFFSEEVSLMERGLKGEEEKRRTPDGSNVVRTEWIRAPSSPPVKPMITIFEGCDE